MKQLAVTAIFAGFSMLVVLPRSANADEWNKRTILTVKEPIQVPGAVLQSGTYIMKLAESSSNRHIVQIFNDRENQLETTILAIPNYRLQPTGDTRFAWWEVPAGQPRTLRAWFYPGDNFGQEFAYPKNTVTQIASINHATVPTNTTVTQSSAQQGEALNQTAQATAPVAPEPTQQEMVTEPTPAQPEQTEVAQNRAPEPVPAAPVTPPARTFPHEGGRSRHLPASGSPYPLFGLGGLCALSAGFLVRRLERAPL